MFGVVDQPGFAGGSRYHAYHHDHYGTDQDLDYPCDVWGTDLVVCRIRETETGVDTGLEVSECGRHVTDLPVDQPNCLLASEAEKEGQAQHRCLHWHFACSAIGAQWPIVLEEPLEQLRAAKAGIELEDLDLREQDSVAPQRELVAEGETQQAGSEVHSQDSDFVHHYSVQRIELQAGLQPAHLRQRQREQGLGLRYWSVEVSHSVCLTDYSN